MRNVRYQQIAGELRRRVAAGEFAGGGLLPSESQLAAAFASSRVTIRRALEELHDEGLIDSRQGFGWFVAADPLRQSLGRLGTIEAQLADAHPFARVTVWCPERLGKDLSLADVERAPFYELLDAQLGGASQTIAAAAANEEDARLLEVPAGSPVLLCRRTTRTVAGEPVLYSEHVFAGHRTEFVVDLPVADRSMAPSGLRLVE